VNRAYETAIRRDPANWFWVHNRWKPAGRRSRRPAVEPDDVLSEQTEELNS